MTRAVAAIALAGLALGACLPILEVKSRTRVTADGTTTRETVITKTRRNANNDDEKTWNDRPIVDDLPRTLGEGFRSVQRGDLEIRLSGTFAHPEQMPPDFLRDVELLDQQARNRVGFVVEDLLFAKRYVYRERYVDAIQPEDLKENKRDAVQFAQKFAHAMIAGEFGRSFDTSELDRFVDGPAADLVGDLIEIYWSERKTLSKPDPVTRKSGLDRALARALKRIERVGVSFATDQSEEDNLALLEAWLRDVFSNSLKRKVDGSRPSLSDFDYFFPPDSPWSGLETMTKRAAEFEYGSTEKAEAVARRVLLGITGTFGSPPAQAEFRFDCAVELPGQLLRTNGYLESERSAFWVFEGEDLFPQGQWLEAESFTPDDRFLGKIRELRSEVDRRDAARLIAALEDVSADDRERLRALLAIAAQFGSLTAIPPAAEGDGQGQSDRRRLEHVVDVLRRDG
ncbi:MAG: hypothetical protein IT459_03590 [Planctomycetes bacterium]|nr:hypothetical protein [Planctomycetota bacterium]